MTVGRARLSLFSPLRLPFREVWQAASHFCGAALPLVKCYIREKVEGDELEMRKRSKSVKDKNGRLLASPVFFGTVHDEEIRVWLRRLPVARSVL